MTSKAALLLAAAALGPGGAHHPVPPQPGDVLSALERRAAAHATLSGKIEHVVIIVQENRSFDNLFQGYPGADTVPSGLNSLGQTIPLAPVGLSDRYQIGHSVFDSLAACDGSPPGQNCKMDGFNNEVQIGGPANGQYVYVPHRQTKPYFAMANEFVLADRMFASQIDESFVAHQYLIAGQANGAVDVPNLEWGCSGSLSDQVTTLNKSRGIGPSEAPCFDYKTIGDELDEAHLSWRFYTSVLSGDGGWWSGYQAVRHIRYGPDWQTDIVTPQTQFITDVGNGKLANVTWITPICRNSDHVNCGSKTGPDWVASLVNAVGESKLWPTTAVFVLWDDWGGTYDHVPPPYADYDGLGFRVPLIAISPYAKHGYVTHVQYETASVLRFAEDTFGLASLAASDARATDPAGDCFDFTQPPRPFVPIPTNLGRAYFMRQHDDGRPPDDG
jgi:phospholipase C